MIEGKRAAIIIGVNKYKHPDKLAELAGAENDAREIGDRLKDPNIGNFMIEKNHFLIGDEATCENIRRAINDVFYKPDPYDMVLFYFSGHGLADGVGNGFISPYDMDPTEPIVCGINMNELKQIIIGSKNKKNIVMILDCCYGGVPTKFDKDATDYKKVIDDNLDALSGEGKFVISATEADKKAREAEFTHENGDKHYHGAFTFHFLEGLDGKAAEGGTSEDDTGFISLGKLINYTQEVMEKEGKQKPKASIFDVSLINKIDIVKNPRTYESQINRLIQETLAGCDKKDKIFTLNNCARNVAKLQSMDPSNTQIGNLQQKITNSLQDYKDKLISHLEENGPQLQPLVDQDPRGKDLDLYTNLYDLENYLTFDKFVRIDLRNLRWLAALCDLINKKITNKTFVSRCLSTTSITVLESGQEGSQSK